MFGQGSPLLQAELKFSIRPVASSWLTIRLWWFFVSCCALLFWPVPEISEAAVAIVSNSSSMGSFPATPPAISINSPVSQVEPTPEHSETGGHFDPNRYDGTLRLRLTWGGATAEHWQGHISIDQGALSDLHVLSTTPDAVSSIVIVGDQLKIKNWNSCYFGGADVTVNYSPGAQLVIQIGNDNANPNQSILTIPLEDLIINPAFFDLDAKGNRLVIDRVAGDELPVRFQKNHLIFEPGEEFSFSFHARRSGLKSQQANCQIKVEPSGKSRSPASASTGMFASHWSSLGPSSGPARQSFSILMDDLGSSEDQAIQWTAPTKEGVYQLTIELTPTWQQATKRSNRSFSRQVQFVVLDRTKPLDSTNQQPSTIWKRVDRILPAGLIDRAGEPRRSIFNRLSASKKVIQSDELKTVTVDDQLLLEMPPGNWQAIPITTEQVGIPHRIEIEYLANQPMSVGISLLESNANGELNNSGFDSGFAISPSVIEVTSHSDQQRLQRHVITIWPNEKQNCLLLANRDPRHSAIIGSIEIFTGPTTLNSAIAQQQTSNPRRSSFQASFHDANSGDQDANDSATSNLVTAGLGLSNQPRAILGFYEVPLFVGQFNGPRGLDQPTGEYFDDWQTFYVAADRWVQHLKANHYAGAFLAINGQGGSLYPGEMLGGSPRWDSGIFFSNGQDPIRKDVMELLFRMFEREGLSLIPMVNFDGPLPELEKARTQRPSSIPSNQSFGLVNWNQQLRDLSSVDLLPVYNPLNETVQAAMVAAIEEIVSRYEHHQSFGGLAVACRPDCYSLLPGQRWGFDQETLERFWAQHGQAGQLPDDWPAIRQSVLGPLRAEWDRWRIDQMTELYRRMTVTVRNRLPQANLFLAPINLDQSEDIRSGLTPSLHYSNDFRQAIRHVGWDAQSLSQIEGLQLLKPRKFAPNQSLANQRIDIGLLTNRSLDDFFRNAGSRDDIFLHRNSWAHFAQLQAEWSETNQPTNPLVRFQTLSPAGIWARQRFVESLRASDVRWMIDGGTLLPTGQNHHCQELMSIFQQLPAAPFVDVTFDHEENKVSPTVLPVMVRYLEEKNQSWIYAVNASPWPIRVRIKVNLAFEQTPKIESLSDVAILQISPTSVDELGALEFLIQPMSLIAGVSNHALRPDSFQIRLPEIASNRLRKQIHILQNKLLQASRAIEYLALDNPSFEVRSSSGGVEGWTASVGQDDLTTGGLEIIRDAKTFDGEQALRMTNRQERPLWLRSNTFPAPITGRLSIVVRLRTEHADSQPPLRISIEGIDQSTDSATNHFYRFAGIGSLTADARSQQIGQQWQRFVVHFDDLPIDQFTAYQIGFDMMGAGQVEVDHVQLFDRWFDERDARAITQRLATCGALLTHPLGYESCRMLLESYWLRFLDEHYSGGEVVAVGEREPGAAKLTAPRPISELSVAEAAAQSRETEATDPNDIGNRNLLRRFRRNPTNRW